VPALWSLGVFKILYHIGRNMNFIDITLLIILVLGMLYGIKKGFITCFLAWIGFFVSMIMLARFGPTIQAGLMIHYNLGIFFSAVIAYLLIIVLIALMIKLLQILLNFVADVLMLTILNRIMGGIFSFLNVLIIIVLLLLFINLFPFLDGFKANLIERSTILRETFRIVETVKINFKDKMPDDYFFE
jgi:membrane protein required for colicin V production